MKTFLVLLLSSIMFSAPITAFSQDLKDEIKDILKENPSIIIDVINENPVIFIQALQNASKKAQELSQSQKQKAGQAKLEAAFANPLKPKIRKDETIRGTRGAPITIVEYSDFQCPFCSRGNATIKALMKKYKGKIQFIYKHLPLSFHSEAHKTAQYYEAIRMQSDKLAFKFHDNIFIDINKLKGGEKALIALAKKSGVNMKKLKRTLKSKIDSINARIKEDIDEAQKFGFQGTPAFIMNGIPIEGAYPLNYFEGLIAELQKRGMLKL
jgi:protein-disulfide isomerase